VSAASGEQIEITRGDQRAVVTEVGAGLRRYSSNGRELLDGYGEDAMSSSGRGQMLIPWPNRIQDGRYTFEGRDHQLPLDDVPEQDAIHGLVRWAAWRAGERAQDRVVMEHVLHPRPGYPFSLALSVEYRLSDEGLEVRTTATNRGSEPCPYGSGNHPYLWLGEQGVDVLTLRIPASTASRWTGTRWMARTTTSAGRGRSARPYWTTPSQTWSSGTTAGLASSSATPGQAPRSPSGSTRRIPT
jgi:aldose 1-epimerase